MDMRAASLYSSLIIVIFQNFCNQITFQDNIWEDNFLFPVATVSLPQPTSEKFKGSDLYPHIAEDRVDDRFDILHVG